MEPSLDNSQCRPSSMDLFRKIIILSLLIVLLPVFLYTTRAYAVYTICHLTTTGDYISISINSKEQALAHKNHPGDFIAPLDGCPDRLITPTPSMTTSPEPSKTATIAPPAIITSSVTSSTPVYPPPLSMSPTSTPTQETPSPTPNTPGVPPNWTPTQSPSPTYTPTPTGSLIDGIGPTAKVIIIAIILIVIALVILFLII
jgi:hypothetical protein